MNKVLIENEGEFSEVFYFKSSGFWIVNIVVALVWLFFGVCAFAAGKNAAGLMIVIFTVLWLILRICFKQRSPQWVALDFVNKVMLIKFRWPRKIPISIDISNLLSAEVSIPISRFPQAILRMKLVNNQEQLIYFDLDKEEKGFYSVPKETIPVEVTSFVASLKSQFSKSES